MNSFIGTRETARRLNISMRRVQALIAAGRLPAQKIGNSFAISESDLKLVNGRANGKPRTADKARRTTLDDHGATPARRGKHSYNKAAYRTAVNKPLEERTQDDWNAIIARFAGCVSLGPPDLSTNKKYLEGLGREKFFSR